MLERRTITPVFQPIMDLRSGLVVAFEGLARFPGADRRPPPAWFADARRCGLGNALEAAAVRAVLAVPGRPAGTHLSFNLSPSAIASPEVQAVLPDDLRGLVIEATENELASAADALPTALADARRRGARIAVEDAGRAMPGSSSSCGSARTSSSSTAHSWTG